MPQPTELTGGCEAATVRATEDEMTCDDDHIITKADAEWLIRERQAPSEAFVFVGMTVAAAARRSPWGAMEYAADRLSPELRAECEALRERDRKAGPPKPLGVVAA